MSLYNMINGFNLACVIIMPMLGRKTDTLHFDRYQSCGEWWGYIECTECIITGPVGKLKKDAIEAWNRRAKDDESGGN